MGGALSSTREFPKPSIQPGLINSTAHPVSLSKIRELHGAFKSMCDSFAMSFTEFQHIFGATEDTFRQFDTDANNIIDSFEVFTGLILFADARTEDKLRCKRYSVLFDLFDFNEAQSISLTDLEFMLNCAVNAALKIHNLSIEVQARDINSLVAQTFPTAERVTLTNLVEFASNSEEVNLFLLKFRIRAIEKVKKAAGGYSKAGWTGKFTDMDDDHYDRQLKLLHETNPKLNENVQKWLSAVLNPLNMQYQRRNVSEGKVALEWVFGIRCEDTRYFIKPIPNKDALVYFVGCVAVVYYPKLLKQKHYLEHSKEIISLAVGVGDIACTGELGDYPSIHIWRPSSLENLEVLSGVHKGAVTFLAFSYNDHQIISCSFYTVVIYEWQTRSVLITTNHTNLIVDLSPLPRLDTGATCSFIISCETEFMMYSVHEAELNVSILKLESSNCKSPITVAYGSALLNVQTENEPSYIVLTGHQDGSVLVWAFLEFRTSLANYEGSITAIDHFFDNYVIASSVGMMYFVSFT